MIIHEENVNFDSKALVNDPIYVNDMVDSILDLNPLKVQIELVKIIEKDDLNTCVKVPNVHSIYRVFVKDQVCVIQV